MPSTDDSRFPDGLVEAVTDAGFELETLAGRGGSGSVYRARSIDGTPVAVKLLDVGTDVGRIRREADALAAVSHAGVPELIDIVEANGRPALLSEWVEGAPLIDELRAGPLSPQRARTIFAGLAEVLDHVHEAGIVHRDLSPDNVIIGAADRVSIIDFGISRSADSATLTAEGMTAGTPRYLAPEVLRGDAPTAATDQYSAAVLLAEMLTGQWPYPDAGDTIATTMHHHLNSAPVPVSETNTWLGTTFDAAIERALAKDPSARFESLQDMLRAIDTPTVAPTRGGGGRSPVLVAVVAVAALAIVAAALFLLWPDGETNVVQPWSAGTAAGLDCNLLLEPDFESQSIPAGFFDAVTQSNDLAPTGGVDASTAIRIGATGDFGLYGETVPIVPGEGYVFRAYVAPTADAQEAIMRMFTLDENFELIASPDDADIGVDEVELILEPGAANHVTLTMPAAAPAARFLVPSLVKEGRDGYLLADELVLAPLSSDCVNEVTR